MHYHQFIINLFALFSYQITDRYRVAQKSKPLPNDQKIALNCIKTCE